METNRMEEELRQRYEELAKDAIRKQNDMFKVMHEIELKNKHINELLAKDISLIQQQLEERNKAWQLAYNRQIEFLLKSKSLRQKK